MIKFFQKHQFEFFLLVALSSLYFLIRIPNLTLQPIFADESIYIRWAQVMRNEPTLRFLPLSDGKTPLFMWVMIPMFKLFSDPLYAGRFLSVIFGFATFLGTFFLGRFFFGKKTGFFSAIAIVIIPFIVFFDRMALVDSMLAAFSIWSLNLSLLLTRFLRIDLAMILGYVLGAGVLTKTPGMFNILLVPITLLSVQWERKNYTSNLIRILLLWIVSIGIAFVIYNLLKLGPGFANLSSRNQDYMFSPFEIITRIHDPFIPHFWDTLDYFIKLITPVPMILIILGIIRAFYIKQKVVMTIVLWAALPLLVEMALLKTFTARYILFSIPPLLVVGGWFSGYFFEKFSKKRLMLYMFAILVLFIPLRSSINLITDPFSANLPAGEREGYFEKWTAGYGMNEIADYLITESLDKPIVVGTEGSFGTLPDGLEIYLEKYRSLPANVSKISIFGGSADQVVKKLLEQAPNHPSFFVTNKSRYNVPDSNLYLEKEFLKLKGKDGSQDAILLYRVKVK